MSKMITLRLSDDRVATLDGLVGAGVAKSRAALMVAALDWWLKEHERRKIDEAIIDGYTRIPPTPEEIAMAEWSTIQSVMAERW